MNGGPGGVRITADPRVSNVRILNLHTGKYVMEAQTPVVASLDRGAGYFVPAKYEVIVDKPGYTPQSFILEGRIDGWYFCNLFVGGLIGMLIVDPLTGDMYVLPREVHAVLTKVDVPRAEVEGHGNRLVLYLPDNIEQIPNEVRQTMQLVER
jgi:hypothetical protein